MLTPYKRMELIMLQNRRLFIFFILLFSFSLSYAGSCATQPLQNSKKICEKEKCCGEMGGISYCDSSAGRLVCNNGYYSSCYCDRHAVMDLQLLKGCCLWQGGVLNMDETGLVVCNNGSVSESCTTQNILPSTPISTW